MNHYKYNITMTSLLESATGLMSLDCPPSITMCPYQEGPYLLITVQKRKLPLPSPSQEAWCIATLCTSIHHAVRHQCCTRQPMIPRRIGRTKTSHKLVLLHSYR